MCVGVADQNTTCFTDVMSTLDPPNAANVQPSAGVQTSYLVATQLSRLVRSSPGSRPQLIDSSSGYLVSSTELYRSRTELIMNRTNNYYSVPSIYYLVPST